MTFSYRQTQRAYQLKYAALNGVGVGKGIHLTAEQDADCARRLARFESPSSIAKDFGVTTLTVTRAAARHKAGKKVAP